MSTQSNIAAILGATAAIVSQNISANKKEEDMKYQEHNGVKFRTGAQEGGSLQGYIDIPYKELEKVLGEPDEEDGDKTLAEWGIRFEDGTYACIYDWKNYGQRKENIRNWHIGGKDEKSVQAIRKLFSNHSVRTM